MFSLSLSPVVLSQYRGGKQEAAGVPQPLACVYSAPCEIKATQKAALKWEPPLLSAPVSTSCPSTPELCCQMWPEGVVQLFHPMFAAGMFAAA